MSTPSIRERLDATLERQPKWVIAMVATLVHGFLYLVPNHFPVFPLRHLPLTAVDRAMPFWPATAWIYWSDYALVFVAFLRCHVPGATARFVYALGAVVLVGIATHWLLPTVYPRELFPLDGDAARGFTAALFARFRAADTAVSCMPSLHVAASYLGAFAVLAHERRAGAWLVLWATAIFVSTLTTKQHYLVDGLAGLALAAVAAWWAFGPARASTVGATLAPKSLERSS